MNTENLTTENKTEALNKHAVSCKQQIQWEAIEAYINRFSTKRSDFRNIMISQARDWFEREFVACASGAVAKGVSDGDNIEEPERWSDPKRCSLGQHGG